MTARRAALVAIVLLATAVVAVAGVLLLSLQRWPAIPGTEHIESGARARLVMWLLWVGVVAAGIAITVALWRPALARTRAAATTTVAIGAVAWTVLVLWAVLIELTIYPTDPAAAAAAAPYATVARVLLGVSWLLGLALAGRLFMHTTRSRR